MAITNEPAPEAILFLESLLGPLNFSEV